uniref:ATPase AAA-type core domain-containing protein n=1 Tax=viral metagenome TaxID=1070528 RepID=A0A6C0C8L8_9ZZZZ
MQKDNNEEEKKTTINIGPDYGQMAKQQTNTAIISCVIQWLFAKDTVFSVPELAKMSGFVIVLITVKTIVENSAEYLNKLQIIDSTYTRYLYQRIRYRYSGIEIYQNKDKWYFDSKDKTIPISMDLLSVSMRRKGIMTNMPGSYYYSCFLYTINVNVNQYMISFRYPDLDQLNKYVMEEIIYPCREIVMSGKTHIYKLTCQTSVLKIEPMEPSNAFATANYRDLEETIKNYFLMDSLLRSNNIPLGIIFSGLPGTGKTSFGSYISSSGIFDKVILCNMVPVTTNNFKDFLVNMERQIAQASKNETLEAKKVLIILDEIDKWVESRINTKIDSMREDARSKTEAKEGANVGFAKLTEKEEEERKIQLRNDFFEQLYSLINGHILSDTRKYVVILNMNGYDRLFQNLDPKFDALLDRFQKYEFNLIGKKEIVEYLENFIKEAKKNLNNQLLFPLIENNSLFQSLDTSSYMYDQIPNDIQISYRSLYKILISKNRNIADIIARLSS